MNISNSQSCTILQSDNTSTETENKSDSSKGKKMTFMEKCFSYFQKWTTFLTWRSKY